MRIRSQAAGECCGEGARHRGLQMAGNLPAVRPMISSPGSSFESTERSEFAECACFDLTIVSPQSLRIRRRVEHAFRENRVTYELWGSSDEELRYEVFVPADQDISKLTDIIRRIDGRSAIVIWHIQRRGGGPNVMPSWIAFIF
jgi:hypothetical protein